jgi:protoheme IX farnesyltransferase
MKTYLTLFRGTVSLFAAASAATGYFLAPHHLIAEAFLALCGVFLLACGASALNQYQEQDIDARMERTRSRPLPSGNISSPHALALACSLVLSGLALIAFEGGAKPVFLSVFAVLWYNGVYTFLKKRTAFAAVPGAAVGMVPPAIGWVSGGGSLFDVRLAAICLLFFLWQVPHFWLLLLNHGEEYEQAGLPSLTGVMSRQQISRVTFIWIAAAAIASLSLPLYGSMRSPVFYFLLVPCSGWLIWKGRILAGKRPDISLSPALFKKINIYLVLIMSLLMLDNLFYRP